MDARRRLALAAAFGLAAAASARSVRAYEVDVPVDEAAPPAPLAPVPPPPELAPSSVPEETWTPSRPLEIGARVGYGSAPIRGGVNPFATGFGARIGYAFSRVYVGATATYYLGGSDVGATDQAILAGAELGYGFRVGELLTIRPMLGVGDAMISHTEPLDHPDVVTTASGSSSTRSSVTTTVHNVYVAPGVTTMIAMGPEFFAITANAFVVPGITYGPAPAQATTWISYCLEGQIGVRF